jgi:hypothetical protein
MDGRDGEDAEHNRHASPHAPASSGHAERADRAPSGHQFPAAPQAAVGPGDRGHTAGAALPAIVDNGIRH